LRRAFCRALLELAERDERIVLLTGDLGFSVLEPFAARFPRQYFNLGVAEQNMIGMATGLAEAGFIPFVYSIVTFASLRAYEFIRNGPVRHQLPVRIIGIGGGFEYGHAGSSHHGLEDVGVMRLQPGMTVCVPADEAQARTAVLALWDAPGPVYFRLGKEDASCVPGLDGRFRPGRAETIGEGKELLLVTTGAIASDVMKAASILETHGASATVAIVSSFNPAPEGDLRMLAQRFPTVMTVEAHYVNGGVGSLMAEVIAEGGLDCRLIRCGVRSQVGGGAGDCNYLNQQHGISPDAIATTARHALSAA
jgi:transketolase